VRRNGTIVAPSRIWPFLLRLPQPDRFENFLRGRRRRGHRGDSHQKNGQNGFHMQATKL
jgi:hypothetical protein